MSRSSVYVRSTDHENDEGVEDAFNEMDTNRSGRIDKPELVRGMSSYRGIKLKEETIVLLSGLYESERTGGLNVRDFRRLHSDMMQWSDLFRAHDVDRQDYIVHSSLAVALQELGYRLDRQTTRSLTRKLGRQAKYIQEDGFIRICCILKRLCCAYRAKDIEKKKNIELSYYEVLHMSLDSCF